MKYGLATFYQNRVVLKNIVQIIACYLAGFLGANFVFLPYAARGLWIMLFAGTILALPILVLVLLVFIPLRKTVMRNLIPWCVVAPFLVTFVWVWLGRQITPQDPELSQYLERALGPAILVFTCASIASALFWFLNRDNNGPFTLGKLRYLVPWYLVGSILLVSGWLAMYWNISHHRWGSDLDRFLLSKETWGLTALAFAFVWISIGSALFWFVNRARARSHGGGGG